jgi:aldose 1-epimerase
MTGKSGTPYAKTYGFCVETQHFPDSPNHPAFPTTEVKPGQTMHSTTVFAFTVVK